MRLCQSFEVHPKSETSLDIIRLLKEFGVAPDSFLLTVTRMLYNPIKRVKP